MLSIKKARGTEPAKYLEKDIAGYLNAESTLTRYHGKGAEALGLFGEVEDQKFRAGLWGKHPNNPNQSLVRNPGENRVSGYGLVYSPHKSLSLLAEFGTPEDRQAVGESMSRGTERISAQMQEVVLTRLGSGGAKKEFAAGLVITEHGHDFARPTADALPDPQRHRHLTLLNLCQRENGTWGTIEGKPLFTHLKMLDALGQQDQAVDLRKNGYPVELERKGKAAYVRIAGITDEQIRAFSKRSEEIKSALGERADTASAKERDVATLATRRKKEAVDVRELRAAWLKEAEATGLLDSIRAIQGTPMEPTTLDRDEVKKYLEERQRGKKLFSREDAIREVAYYGIERNAPASETLRVVTELYGPPKPPREKSREERELDRLTREARSLTKAPRQETPPPTPQPMPKEVRQERPPEVAKPEIPQPKPEVRSTPQLPTVAAKKAPVIAEEKKPDPKKPEATKPPPEIAKAVEGRFTPQLTMVVAEKAPEISAILRATIDYQAQGYKPVVVTFTPNAAVLFERESQQTVYSVFTTERKPYWQKSSFGPDISTLIPDWLKPDIRTLVPKAFTPDVGELFPKHGPDVSQLLPDWLRPDIGELFRAKPKKVEPTPAVRVVSSLVLTRESVLVVDRSETLSARELTQFCKTASRNDAWLVFVGSDRTKSPFQTLTERLPTAVVRPTPQPPESKSLERSESPSPPPMEPTREPPAQPRPRRSTPKRS